MGVGVKRQSPACTDAELLKQFAAGDQVAFAALVNRHINVVHSSSLRRSGNAAEDVTQAVFLMLARNPVKAARAAERVGGLTAWLLTITRHLAANANRRRRRRDYHERRAAVMDHVTGAIASGDPTEVLIWRELVPLLDDAVLSLSADDRAAVLLKFYENRPATEIADALGCSHDAARQRLSRALSKLRKRLERRGVELPLAMLASLLAAHAVRAAPSHLPATCSALATGGTASAAVLLLCKGTTMTSTLLKLSAAATVAGIATTGILLAGGDVPVAKQATTSPPPTTVPTTRSEMGAATAIDAAALPVGGDVIERTLSAKEDGEISLDIDTGTTYAGDDFVTPGGLFIRHEVLESVDANLFADPTPGLRGQGLAVRPVVPDMWDQDPPPIALIGSLWHEQVRIDGGGSAWLDAIGDLPRTFLFRTDEGSGGVLQIVRRHDDGSLDVRYRILLRGEGRTVVSQVAKRRGDWYDPNDPVEARMLAIGQVGQYTVHLKVDNGRWPESITQIRESVGSDPWPEELPETLTFVAPVRDPNAPRIGTLPMLFETVNLTDEQLATGGVMVGFDDNHVEHITDREQFYALLKRAGLNQSK